MLNTMKCALGLALTLVLSACAPGADEPVGESRSAVVTNGGFETGAAGAAPPSWTLQTFLNQMPGITVQAPQTRAGLNLMAGGNALTTIVNGANQPDPDLGAAASLRWPRYGAQCARINFHSNNPNNPRNVNSLTQTMTIAAGDVDPDDNQIHIRFAFAPVLQNPAHPPAEQPYYFIQISNVTKNTILYRDFNLSAQAGIPWKTVNGGTMNEIDYVDWTLVDVAPGPAALAMNDQVSMEFMAAGCDRGAHFGELYLDGVGATIPGLFVTGSAPAQANAGSNLVYSMRYKNGSAAAETGVVIRFMTPPNTTFQAITPPAGAVCVSPTVGTAGTIVCTFAAPVPAAGAGTFSVTVNINAGTTGQIVCGNYQIQSTQETPLLGSRITTTVGCALDSDCPANTWCNEAAKTCGPKLANGVAIPTDAPHTNPTLNGTCTAAAGTLVCTSAVCDTDNKCGRLNGDGPCTVATGNVVCRSAVCDPDLKCGYANGDGPCTAANAATVCRSGSCSTNLLCKAAGGCNVDADCTGGQWCTESTHTCTAKLANGTMLPTDAPHTNPTLNGTCTAAAATLVCTSAACDTTDNKCGRLNGDGPCTVATGNVVCRSTVCDPDLKCGYANGDGPCTTGNAATVCRSGACGANALCKPAGGCNVDADCTGGQWCTESTHTCTAKLGNGTPIPNDAPHTNPTLNGTCTAAAGTLVCTSAVCDTADAKCGFANGDGPCTIANGPTVCRSATCSASGVCLPPGGCNTDVDCASGTWCNESMHACMPTLPNASPVPSDAPHMNPTLDGTCSAAAGALVCTSGVCDGKDDACGYQNGSGPCTTANGASVCRSTICASAGANQGTCVACVQNSDCAGATPVCNPATNTCVGCATSADCPNTTPVCDPAMSACTQCNGDNGAAVSDPCPTAAAGLCFLSGAKMGQCGSCSADADCQGHTGNLCDTASGSCTTGCRADSDCMASEWCNAEPNAVGMCVPKLPNGTPLPQTPSTVGGTCTGNVGARVCAAGACDVKDNTCGFATGDGSCQNDEQCRQGSCNPMTQTCGMVTGTEPDAGIDAGTGPGPVPECMIDADCPQGYFCNGNACVAKLPTGASCSAVNQCQSNDCRDSRCSSIIGQGAGVLCSTGPVGSPSSGGRAAFLGLMLALAGLARRRQSA
ncbi:MAG TPA: hypothetical protein VGI10_10775 [Polyangiaceae bacterium]|jgi:hypothetical protein